ncbi:hypothetical protein V6N12_009943 [Hibiscus sabdariffa]|uniref:Uncharacterized protein n=1 Tax=Hibiscus sabdariffa TaxID=183260 RepID=A0ABR2EC80_9ROSI
MYGHAKELCPKSSTSPSNSDVMNSPSPRVKSIPLGLIRTFNVTDDFPSQTEPDMAAPVVDTPITPLLDDYIDTPTVTDKENVPPTTSKQNSKSQNNTTMCKSFEIVISQKSLNIGPLRHQSSSTTSSSHQQKNRVPQTPLSSIKHVAVVIPDNHHPTLPSISPPRGDRRSHRKSTPKTDNSSKQSVRQALPPVMQPVVKTNPEYHGWLFATNPGLARHG